MSNAIMNITFSCGHTDERDLSNKLPEDRAGFAKWLNKQPCGSCHYAANKTTIDAKNRQEYFAKQNQEIEADIEDNQLPALHGSGKQIPWAKRVRFEKIRAAYETEVEEGELSEDEFETAFVEQARLITSARWWIDNKDADPSSLPQLIGAARGDSSMTINENPY